jgi:hypothetical protein
VAAAADVVELLAVLERPDLSSRDRGVCVGSAGAEPTPAALAEEEGFGGMAVFGSELEGISVSESSCSKSWSSCGVGS